MAHLKAVVAVFLTVLAVSYGQNTCPFFSSTRIAKAQSNMPNCTWYESNTCCERAEVTAVFQDMLSVQDASQACRNRLNYMMCYMCDPTQRNFLIGGVARQARICSEFCDDTFNQCKDARFNGIQISSRIANGRVFCENNFFVYTTSNTNCLKFDASVFSSATSVHMSGRQVLPLLAVSSLLVFLIQLLL